MFFSEPQFLQPYIKDTDTTGNYNCALFAIHNTPLPSSRTPTPSAQKTFTECSCTSPPTSTTRTFAGDIRCLKWRYSQSPTTACKVKAEVRPGCGSRSAPLEDANRSEPLSSEGLLSVVMGHNELGSTQYKGVSQVWATDVTTTRARTGSKVVWVIVDVGLRPTGRPVCVHNTLLGHPPQGHLALDHSVLSLLRVGLCCVRSWVPIPSPQDLSPPPSLQLSTQL